MKKFILLGICALCMCSCIVRLYTFTNFVDSYRDFPPELVEGRFTANRNMGIDSILRTDGYYMMGSDELTMKMGSRVNYILYKDGIVGVFYTKKNNMFLPNKGVNMKDSIERLYNGVYCCGGDYVIHGDTLLMEIAYADPGVKRLYKIGYKIIDREHIRQIYCTKYVRSRPVRVKPLKTDFVFVPCKDLPSSYFCVIRDEKWMWKSQAEQQADSQKTTAVRNEYIRNTKNNVSKWSGLD